MTTGISKMTKRDFIEFYKERIYVADQELLEIIMAAYTANYIQGNPFWLLVIGQSGGGKSTGVEAFYEHCTSYQVDDMTDGALASGFTGVSPEDFIIEKIKDKVVLISDLAGILQMPQDARNKLLSAFRRIYDGEYSREWGSGQEAVKWKGKVGLIGATVPETDQVIRKMMDLGERFVRVYTEYSEEDALLAIQRALENVGKEAQIKEELQQAGNAFLDEYIPKAQAGIGHIQRPSWWNTRLINIANLTATLRTPASRTQGGEIKYDPAPEIGTRLVKQFSQLAHGNCINEDRGEVNERDLQLVLRLAVNSIQKRRGLALSALMNGCEHMKDIEKFTATPARTIGRELEFYQHLKVVEQADDYTWSIVPRVMKELSITGLHTKIMNTYPQQYED